MDGWMDGWMDGAVSTLNIKSCAFMPKLCNRRRTFFEEAIKCQLYYTA
jgi:hypothetical protein